MEEWKGGGGRGGGRGGIIVEGHGGVSLENGGVEGLREVRGGVIVEGRDS